MNRVYYINYFTHCRYYNKINYRRPGWGEGSIGTERAITIGRLNKNFREVKIGNDFFYNRYMGRL